MSDHPPKFPTLTGTPPIVIAHRGASGDRPEHTLAAYQRAIAQGADFIEPDLVVSRDGVLVARHENAIATVTQTGAVGEATTDVANRPEFADRLTTKTVDGRTITGWFTEDFTLAELKSLTAKERLPQLRGTEFDDQGLKILTLGEIISLVKQAEVETGRKVGIYPETKHPTYFASEGAFLSGEPINLSLGQLLVDVLIAEDFIDTNRIFIQSFETSNLKELKQTILPKAGVNLPLIQLISDRVAPYDLLVNNSDCIHADLCSTAGLAEIAAYAQGIGPAKHLVLPVDENNTLLEPTSLIQAAHQAGLLVHIYTLRNEAGFLAPGYGGNPEAEVQQFIGLGVDGYFTDFPATGSLARSKFAKQYL